MGNLSARFNAESFFARVQKTDTCWIWTGARHPSGGRWGTGGYGRYAQRMAHRVIYEHVHGPIPEGMQIDHLCGVPSCVNPDHLEVVTGEENLRRYWAAYTHCKNGHEFNEANTYNRPTGGRSCRACGRDRVRQYLARKAAKAV